MATHPVRQEIDEVTERIIERSRRSRAAYLRRLDQARRGGRGLDALPISGAAHVLAAMDDRRRLPLYVQQRPYLGVHLSVNDVLSSGAPFWRYPGLVAEVMREIGAESQVVNTVPGPCDGILQGTIGMQLSLLFREMIAMATVAGFAQSKGDADVLAGDCDKIFPGMVVGALLAGAHKPCLWLPSGTMPSGVSNAEKNETRKRHVAGEVDDGTVIKTEFGAYHAPGVCTFFGTANTNVVMGMILGLMLPGAFVNPNTPLRDALTKLAAREVMQVTSRSDRYTPIGHVIDEKAIVNAVVMLMAMGGSTNHTMHLINIAKAAGIKLTWDDFADISEAVPLLAWIYPNGDADVNDFEATGGFAFVLNQLLRGRYLHRDVKRVHPGGLEAYTKVPRLAADGVTIEWDDVSTESPNPDIVRTLENPFSSSGGLRVLKGTRGSVTDGILAITKVSGLPIDRQVIEAPALVFESQDEVKAAYTDGRLDRDCVVVVRFQGPRANGMPELHELIRRIALVREKGFKCALLTDGRLSGASGGELAAIEFSPEAAYEGSPLARLEDGDVVRIDAMSGTVEVLVDPETFWDRPAAEMSPGVLETIEHGWGQEVFAGLRRIMLPASLGAGTFGLDDDA